MSDFAHRFRRARDGDLTPSESWLKKKNDPYFHRGAELCFVRLLEHLQEEDYAEAMIYAAMLPIHNVALSFRSQSGDPDVMRLFVEEGMRCFQKWRSPTSSKASVAVMAAIGTRFSSAYSGPMILLLNIRASSL